MRVVLVCSTGGHLTQLMQLQDWWTSHERHWVTFDKPDARSLLARESVTWAHHPTTRSIPNLLRNFVVALRVLEDFRPDVIVSTGAAVAVPFFLLGRLLDIRTVYVEVYDRIDVPTLTGRICTPLTDLFLLQWDQQRTSYPQGVVVGRLM